MTLPKKYYFFYCRGLHEKNISRIIRNESWNWSSKRLFQPQIYTSSSTWSSCHSESEIKKLFIGLIFTWNRQIAASKQCRKIFVNKKEEDWIYFVMWMSHCWKFLLYFYFKFRVLLNEKSLGYIVWSSSFRYTFTLHHMLQWKIKMRKTFECNKRSRSKNCDSMTKKKNRFNFELLSIDVLWFFKIAGISIKMWLVNEQWAKL